MDRKCKCGCGVELLPAAKCTDRLSKQRFASIDCLFKVSRAKEAAKSTKVIKKRNSDLKKKVKANPRALALKTAQMLARISGADGDGNCVCVTCGHTGPWNDGFDGGHFIAKGSCSFWMLDPRNIHPQCKGCNGFNMKHGSAPIKYTRWMTLMYGSEFVDHMLANTNTIIKRTAKDYEQFISEANAEILIHKKRIGQC